MTALKKLLDGKKTVIGTALIGLLIAIQPLGFLTEIQWSGAMAGVTFLTGVSARIAIKKSGGSS